MASMKKMQELSPILNKIKEKYKDDKARQQQEMMNLYKTYKINPMSGCLPMLLQIPVFIALYKGLLVAIELRHAPFMFWGFPTGLTIYWLVNNLLSIGQQLIQNRQMEAEKAARA